MSKKTIIGLSVAAALVLVGGIVFSSAMAALHWDFSKLSTEKYVTNEYIINQDFYDISVAVDTADLEILPSENGQTRVVCYEPKKAFHSALVQGETLTLRVNDTRKWYEHIGIHLETAKITVYLPQNEYGDLRVETDTSDVKIPENFVFTSVKIKGSTGDVDFRADTLETATIKTSTGDITVENISAKGLELTTSTGDITVGRVNCAEDLGIHVSTGDSMVQNTLCQNLSSSGSTGDIRLENTVAAEKMTLVRSTGSVHFQKSDASEISVKTDTGNVKGTLRSDKVFFAESDTGSVTVPKTLTGGRCEISTDTGDIKIEIAP